MSNSLSHHSPSDGFVERRIVPPLVPIGLREGLPTIWCKLEFLNQSGSTKDRIANFILGKAVRQDVLKSGSNVVEASSGSTSIAMACTCAQLGLRFIAVMPEGVSNERTLIIKRYGGEVVFSPGSEGIVGAMETAAKIAKDRSAFFPRQFENPDNPAAHRYQTAQEIMTQISGGVVNGVVSGVGTGGTLVGLYEGFTDFGCAVTPFAAKPMTGENFSDAECCTFSSRIPGVVDGLSKIYDRSSLPELIELDVDDDRALEITRELIRKGFPVGPSSGLNYQAALQAAERLGSESQIVTVFPDRMERYFSTELFADLR